MELLKQDVGCVRRAEATLFNGRNAAHVSHDQQTSMHSLHLCKICIPIDGVLLFTWPNQRTLRTREAIWVAADQLHSLSCEGTSLTLFLEPEASDVRTILATLCASWKLLSPFHSQSLKEAGLSYLDHFYEQDAVETLFEEAIALLLPGCSSPLPLDGRLEYVLTRLQEHEDGQLPLQVLADEVSLSSFRLAHLFREQVGLPIRRYLLWIKLMRACNRFFQGQSWIDAAYSAGFADQAHLSRTTKKLLGRTPSSLSRDHSKIVQAFDATLLLSFSPKGDRPPT